MKAIVCSEPYNFLFIEKPEPQPTNNEAIIRIRRIGICGTDLHAYQGNQPYFEYPRILGHELSGEIEYVPQNDKDLKKDDNVTIFPYVACGKCAACRNNKPNCCVNLSIYGIHMDGGMQELIKVPYNLLIKTETLSLDQLALVECLSIGAHANRRAKIKKGEFVLVVGAGPIGMGIMSFAKINGAKVIAMDISENRLSFSRKNMGADFVINANDNPLEELNKITGSDLPDIVFDATGNPKSMETSFKYIAHGGKLIFVSLVDSNINFYDPDFHKRETTLLSSRNSTKEDFLTVIDALDKGYIDIDPCITHSVSFDNLPEIFPQWIKPETGVIKAIVTL